MNKAVSKSANKSVDKAECKSRRGRNSFCKIGVKLLDKLEYRYESLLEKKIRKMYEMMLNTADEAVEATKTFTGGCIAAAAAAILLGTVLTGIGCDIGASVYMSFICIAMPLAKYMKLRRSVKERQMHMSVALPDVLAAFVILLDAGISVREALSGIADSSQHGPLHEEMRKTFGKIRMGVPEAVAFGELAQRCPLPEMSVFVSLIIQSTVKGGGDMSSTLRMLTERARESRRNTALKYGEEAKTKCLLPQTMIFAAIMLVTGYPAFCAFTKLI